jgi:Amt family ammonium transporter
MHPVGSFLVGGIAGVIFVKGFQIAQFRLKIDDVLGVWPLHGLCGLWGGIAAGIFGLQALGGLGGVSTLGQIVGSLMGAGYAFVAGLAVYSILGATLGLRLTAEEERRGADLSIHRVGANPEADIIG